jgi:hypothetical protein
MFEEERNINVFKCKTSKLKEDKLSELMDKYHEHMLIEIPLHDGKRYYTIMGTYKEEQELDIFVEKIYNTIEDVKQALSKVPFKKKYREVIDALSTVSEEVEVNHETHVNQQLLSINLFFIFYRLFGQTFLNNRLEDD